MSTIQEDVKTGQLKQIYLLCGDEAYQRNRYRDYLKNALCKDLDSMNINIYAGKDISVPAVIDASETMPFFADRRVIIIENSGLFSSKGEQLAEYISEIPPTTYLIFVEEEVDKRSRLYKAVSKDGKVETCEMLRGTDLQDWLLKLVGREKKKISEKAFRLFVEKTDSDMNNMRMEMEKLICYVGDRDSITEQDVEAICTTRVNSKVFDLIDAIALKNQKQALSVYADMLELKEPPMRILFLIARHFSNLTMVKELKQKGHEKHSIASKIGLQPFVADKYITQASRFTMKEVRKALEDSVITEEEIKTGKITDSLAVELLIVKYSKK